VVVYLILAAFRFMLVNILIAVVVDKVIVNVTAARAVECNFQRKARSKKTNK